MKAWPDWWLTGWWRSCSVWAEQSMIKNQDGSSSAGGEISTARALFPFSQAQVRVSLQSHTRFIPTDRGQHAFVSGAHQDTSALITTRQPPTWRKVGIGCTHAGAGGWNSHPSLYPGQDHQLGEGASAWCMNRITLHCSTRGTCR